MKRILILFALVGVTMSAAACGNGGETADTPPSDSNGAAGTTATDVTVVTLDTFAFEPAAVTASAGQTLNLTLDNSGGALEHTWVVLNEGLTRDEALNIADQGDEDKKFFEARAAAGETTSATFTAPATPGEYVVVCAVAGHAAGGMIGSLTVQ